MYVKNSMRRKQQRMDLKQKIDANMGGSVQHTGNSIAGTRMEDSVRQAAAAQFFNG